MHKRRRMDGTSSDNILLLKQRQTEQDALINALQEILSNREHKLDYLHTQLDNAAAELWCHLEM